MKFRFVWIGKTRDKDWKTLQDRYWKRLSHFVTCEISELRETAKGENKETEGKRILQLLNPKSFAVLLDVTGEPLSSHELAKRIEKWQIASQREVIFIICGPDGASSELAMRADYRLSLSILTFTHEMARVLLLEQLYRAFSIIKRLPYQK
jgi:23S rRNA (pseudouridine1915-N3)-methyltransferase